MRERPDFMQGVSSMQSRRERATSLQLVGMGGGGSGGGRGLGGRTNEDTSLWVDVIHSGITGGSSNLDRFYKPVYKLSLQACLQDARGR